MENKEIHFNEYGSLTLPNEIFEARIKYWKVIEPYLDKMSVVEVRAFEMYVNMGMELAGYILRRQSKERKWRKGKP